jgi:hypothetical protein
MKLRQNTTASGTDQIREQFTALARDVAALSERPHDVTIGDLARLLDRLRGELAMADGLQKQSLHTQTGADDFAFLADEAEIEALEPDQIASLSGHV